MGSALSRGLEAPFALDFNLAGQNPISQSAASFRYNPECDLNAMKSPLLVPVLLYLAACFIPVLDIWKTDHHELMFGGFALVTGWLGLLTGAVAWIANPLFLTGLVLAKGRKPMRAIVPSVAAVVIACTLFRDVGRDLSGEFAALKIFGLRPGFYCWMASLVALPIAAILQSRRTAESGASSNI